MIKMESIPKKREAIIINRNDLLILAISFLISRVEVLNQLTPFGIAYLGASLLLGRGSFALALSIALGIFSCQGFGGTSYALAILVIYTYFSRIKPSRSYTIFKGSFLVGQLFFIINILLSFIGGNLAYSLLITLFESLLIFTMTYVFTFSITIDKRKLRSISNEELICSILTMALILSGFGDISIYGLSIKNILSISIILYISNEQGSLMGVATAVVIGMVSYISHVEMPFIISVLAVGALLSGIFRDLGKYGSILGFILGNAIISYYINNFATSFLNLKEILIASIIFMTLCKYLKFDLREYMEGNLKIKEKYTEQREAYLLGKLDKTKDLLYSLSGIIEDSVGKEQLHTNKDVYSLVDEITNKSCKGCESYEKCWKDDYLTTSKTILNLIGQIETRAKSHEELLNQLDGKCHSAEELLELALESHQVFINGQTLNNKLLEHRRLLGEQIKNLGKVVEDIERSISISPIFHTEIEESLIKELRNKKIEVVDLVVLEVEEGNLEILLELDMSRNIRYGIVEIKNQISKELNIPFLNRL